MARRQRYAEGAAGAPPIGPLPRQGTSTIPGDLARFGQSLAEIQQKFIAGDERSAAEKAQREVAGGTFKPQDETLRVSRAYNRAGFDAYFDNLQITTADEVDRIYRQYQTDPAGLETALSGYRDGIEKNLSEAMPGLMAPFRSYFDRVSRPARSKVANDWQREQDAEFGEQAKTSAFSRLRQAENRAFLSPAQLNPATFLERVADMAIDRSDYMKSLEKAQTLGAMSAADVGNALRTFDFDVKKALVKGAFVNASQRGRGAKFVENFAKDKAWLADNKFTPDERDAIAGELITLENRDAHLRASRDAALADDVRAAIGTLRAGNNVAALDALRARAVGTPFAADLDAAERMQDRIVAARQLPPQAQRERIDEMQRKNLAGGLTGEESQLFEALKVMADQTERAIADDPMGWATEVGLVELPPMLNEDGKLNVAGMAQRVDAGASITKYTGRNTGPIRRHEAEQFVAGLVASGVAPTAEALGADPKTGASLKQAIRMVEPDFPQVAQIATFAMNGRRSPSDNANVASLLSRGYSLTQGHEGKPALFKFKAGAEGRAAFDQEFNKYVGETFAGNAAARQRAADGVFAVYAAYAENAPEGLTGAFDDNTFERAATAYFGGRKVKVNGGQVFAPYGMGVDDFTLGLNADIRARLKDSHTPEQIDALIRNGSLQHTADGYALIVGDSYVAGPDDLPLEFVPRPVPPGDPEAIKAGARARFGRESEAR